MNLLAAKEVFEEAGMREPESRTKKTPLLHFLPRRLTIFLFRFITFFLQHGWGALRTRAFFSLSDHLGLKVLTFSLNAWLIRVLTPSILGVANVRLMLLYTTLSFLVREPFRRSCIKEEGQTPANRDQWAALVNTLWLCPLLCVPVAFLLVIIWIGWLEQPDMHWYKESVWVYAGSLWLECLAEPLWILGQQFHFVRAKAGIEASQLFVRNITVFILTAAFPDLRLAVFPIAMALSSVLYTVLWLRHFAVQFKLEEGRAKRRKEDELDSSQPVERHGDGLSGLTVGSLFPQPSAGLDKESLAVGRDFFTHCFLKHFLTEGERLLMTFTGILSFADQGVYDAIHNLGSLVARIVFAPLEESAHTFFSLNLRRGVPADEQDPERLRKASQLLRHLLRLTMLMGLVVCVFGFSYAKLALHLYAGPVLSRGIGVQLLKAYCPYILLLALNGISESFLFTIIDGKQMLEMNRHKALLIGTCFGFVGIVYVGQSLGTLVFVLANAANMIARICFSLYHIGSFYASASSVGARFPTSSQPRASSPLSALVPPIRIGATLIGTGFMTTLTGLIFGLDGMFNVAAQGAFGAISLIFVLFTIYSDEQELVAFIETHIVRNKAKAD